MPDRTLPDPETAADVFAAMVASAGDRTSSLNAITALQHFGRFAATPFDLPDVPDCDGLLYQFGTFSWTGEQRFHLDLVRQFAAPDEDEYVQFHCDLRFAPTPELEALGGYEEWWWPGQSSLADWLADISSRPEWYVLSSAVPASVHTRTEQT